MIMGPQFENWRAYHFFYHADRTQLLRYLAIPLMRELLEQQLIDRFFFVQYNLGGPHIRFRWRATFPARAAEAEARLASHAEEFLSRLSSPSPLPEEEIRRTNRSLVDLDPAVGPEDDTVYPDNTYRSFPVHFEIDRYGGSGKFAHSLDLFTVSSAHVLMLLSDKQKPDGWTRPALLRLVLKMAWGLSASDPDLFEELAGYAVTMLGDNFGPCIDQADSVFERRSSELQKTVSAEVDSLATPVPGHRPKDWLAAGSYQLSTYLDGISASSRWHIAASHIHMTANRLGINNPEEVYLSRMLWRTIRALRTQMPERWQQWWKYYPGTLKQSQSGPLENTVISVLEALTSPREAHTDYAKAKSSHG